MSDKGTDARRHLKGIIAHLKELPALPAVAVQALNLTTDEFSDFGKIARLIGSDPALAIKILKLANSPVCGAGRTCVSVEEAVPYLGIATLKCAILGIMVRETFLSGGKTDPLHLELWKHSLACAVAARLLCAAAGPGAPDKDEAFVAGLLHDIGRMVISAALPGEYDVIRRQSLRERLSMTESEERVLGVHHGLVGKWLAQTWALPQALADVVWLHHQPQGTLPPLGNSENLIHTIKLADCLAHEVLLDYDAPQLGDGELGDILARLGLKASDVDDVLGRIGKEFAARAAVFDLEGDEAALYFESLQRASGRLSRLALDLERKNGVLGLATRIITMTGEAGLRLAQTLEPREMLGTVARILFERMGMAPGLVYRLNRRDLVLEGVAWDEAGEFTDMACYLDDDITPRRDDEFARLPGFVRGLVEGYPKRRAQAAKEAGEPVRLASEEPFFIAPMTIMDEFIGEICFAPASDDRARLSAREQSGYLQLAALTSASLNNARLREELEERAEHLSAALLKNQRINLQLMQAERLAAVGQLAAGAAHEINNPLAIIYARAQLLMLKEKDEGKKKVLKQMTGQIERISSILTNLMNFARPAPPRLGLVSVVAVLDRALGLIEGSFPRLNIRVERDYQLGLPAIRADANQLEGVFLNLLINSQHAMEKKGGVLSVSAGLSPDKRYIVAAVEDQGMGIPEESLPKIFDPFFTTKEEGKGTGLGLSTAYGIVTAHDGRMEVRSKVGEGTVVTVTLPVEDKSAAQSSAAPAAKVGRGAARKAGDAGAILVVDDEEYIRDILREALESEGFKVDMAANGQEGAEKLTRNRYCLVLLDMRMPLRSGLSLLAEIKRVQPDFPVIVITGLAGPEEMDKALAMGAERIVQKPFQIKPLLKDIRDVLKASAARSKTLARS